MFTISTDFSRQEGEDAAGIWSFDNALTSNVFQYERE